MNNYRFALAFSISMAGFEQANSVPLAEMRSNVIKLKKIKKIAEKSAICAEKVPEAASAKNYLQETL
ncbi:MAG TPA: hypothetical protein PLK28_15930 [Candidatus Rifleibacterium sp.]|nr:hypothetical protein [Candidatus Rifleibacterium sp.]HPW58066.1 hypothetical protein [Candidatus Rifleibacterium sp.]